MIMVHDGRAYFRHVQVVKFLHQIERKISHSQFKQSFFNLELRNFQIMAFALLSSTQPTQSIRIVMVGNASMNHFVSKICLPLFCPHRMYLLPGCGIGI
jgi:hypothetical protein